MRKQTCPWNDEASPSGSGDLGTWGVVSLFPATAVSSDHKLGGFTQHSLAVRRHSGCRWVSGRTAAGLSLLVVTRVTVVGPRPNRPPLRPPPAVSLGTFVTPGWGRPTEEEPVSSAVSVVAPSPNWAHTSTGPRSEVRSSARLSGDERQSSGVAGWLSAAQTRLLLTAPEWTRPLQGLRTSCPPASAISCETPPAAAGPGSGAFSRTRDQRTAHPTCFKVRTNEGKYLCLFFS